MLARAAPSPYKCVRISTELRLLGLNVALELRSSQERSIAAAGARPPIQIGTYNQLHARGVLLGHARNKLLRREGRACLRRAVPRQASSRSFASADVARFWSG
jgi:hypothetical protein